MAIKLEDRFKTAEKPKTYEDFESEAKASGLYDTFDAKDLERAKTDVNYGYGILSDKKGWTAAQAAGDTEGMKFYSELADTRRQSYGNSSGKQSEASKNLLAIIKQYDDSLPSDKGSKYMTSIDKLLAKIAGDTFSYDAKSDPRYALAEEYAQKAMENQMAESALLTGGYGNSYAAHAGQQVYTDYMNDAVNDMEDRAYSKWAAERDNNYSLLGVIQGLEQQEYDRAQTERQWQYQTEQDAKADAETKKTNAQNIVYDYIRINGSVDGLSEEELAATGWSKAYIDSLVTEARNTRADEATAAGVPEFSAEQALSYYVGGNKSSKVLEAMQYHFGDDYAENAESYYKNMVALNNAASGGNPVKEYEPPLTYTTAYKQYMEEGDRSGAVMETLEFYDFKFEEEEETVLPETVYSEALNYIASEGVNDAYRNLLIPAAEFENSLKKNGSVSINIDGTTMTFYSYDDYVDRFVAAYSKKKAPTSKGGATILSEPQFESRKRGGTAKIDGYLFDDYESYKEYVEVMESGEYESYDKYLALINANEFATPEDYLKHFRGE